MTESLEAYRAKIQTWPESMVNAELDRLNQERTKLLAEAQAARHRCDVARDNLARGVRLISPGGARIDDLRQHAAIEATDEHLIAWRSFGSPSFLVGHRLGDMLDHTDSATAFESLGARLPFPVVAVVHLNSGRIVVLSEIGVVAPVAVLALGCGKEFEGIDPIVRSELENTSLGAMLCVSAFRESCVPRGNTSRNGATPDNSGLSYSEVRQWVVGQPINLGRADVPPAEPGTRHFRIRSRFIVRGHWRNQSCGPARSLRRPRWILPYWKGPKSLREALMRTYSWNEEERP